MKDRGSARPPTPASRGSQTGTRNHQERLQWIAGAGLLGLAIAAAVSFSRVRVCDQELTGEGKAVAVCRHLQMTDPPVVAFGGSRTRWLSRSGWSGRRIRSRMSTRLRFAIH